MALAFLLDENLSPVIAAQVTQHRPDITVLSAQAWQGGQWRGRTDKALLLAARTANLTLLTYDQKTIPDTLIELDAAGEYHAGVIFVDEQTIAGNDFGLMTRAIIFFYDRFHTWEWRNRIAFLDKPPRE